MESQWPISLPGVEPVRLLGQGGFGQVWLANQTDLDRAVAVKVGHRPFGNDDDRRRFERECMALGRLSGHPHIIGVHTSGFVGPLPYLVLEYIEGGTLGDHGQNVGEARLRIIAKQLCEAVAAAHEIGVVHRDLKPENVFLRANGDAVLGDFGIARLDDGSQTAAGGVTASMAFAAPEILEGHPPTPAADVYGIGITIAAAVLGRSPFVTENATTLEAVIVQVLQATPPDLTKHGISPQFQTLLLWAMSRDPNARPSAQELQAAIAQLPSVGAIAAANPPTAQAAAPHQPVGRPVTTGPQLTPAPLAESATSSDRSMLPIVAGLLLGLGLLLAVTVALFNPFASSPETADETETATDAEAGASTDNASDSDAYDTEPGSGFPTPEVTGPEIVTPEISAPQVTGPGLDQSTTTTPPQPLVLPLTSAAISDLADIPIDTAGLDPLLGPANSAGYCDLQPDVTGLVETVAAIYPTDPTAGGSFRQTAQRMHRFDTPEQASAFIESYTTIPCESWEATDLSNEGVSVLTATEIPATVTVGDEVAQIDEVTTLPVGVELYGRTVLVRSDRDVFKLFYLTLDRTELTDVTDRLLLAAVDSLGY